ncbi:hypothetical protein DM860_004456 [Cuscuta australis]|uniref:10 kDa chaperonin n=1 Tax=Cuscuta australis TaxID=267555 RepID=A0A328E7H0_9ASTE|nr:hypothetical protein DM860_004456 [Cuscuta australis]
MASALLTSAKPFFSTPSLASNPRPVGLRRNSLRVNAIATKYEPSKVVPQADRVLIRLEALPEKSAGGVLLPKSAVKFERYLMGEVLSVGTDVRSEVEAGKKVWLITHTPYVAWIFLISIASHPCVWVLKEPPAHPNPFPS